jgi:hypothetical protein
MIWHVDGITVRGHSGGYPGFATKIGFAPELRLAAAALTNSGERTAHGSIDVIFHAVAWVTDRWETAAETGHGHTRAGLGRFVGQYRGDVGEWTVVRINRSLYLVDSAEAAPLTSAARLQPEGARRFTIVEGDDYGHFGEEVSFSLNAAGRCTSLKYGPHTMPRADI